MLAIAVLGHLVANAHDAGDYSKRIERHFARSFRSLVDDERAIRQLHAADGHAILVEFTLSACISRLNALLPMHPPVSAFTFNHIYYLRRRPWHN